MSALAPDLHYPRHTLRMYRAHFEAGDRGQLFADKNLVDAVALVCACCERLPVSIELAGDVVTSSAVWR